MEILVHPEQEIKIIEKFLRDDRFFVKLSSPWKGRTIWPEANYVWLLNNPSFEEIPKGYVIHHLDENEQNDDPTNLVLMQKYQHVAYHWKRKPLHPQVKIKFGSSRMKRTLYFPISEPRILKRKSGSYYLFFRERLDGTRKAVSIYSWDGFAFKSKEMAEKAKKLIWPESRGEVIQELLNW